MLSGELHRPHIDLNSLLVVSKTEQSVVDGSLADRSEHKGCVCLNRKLVPAALKCADLLNIVFSLIFKIYM